MITEKMIPAAACSLPTGCHGGYKMDAESAHSNDSRAALLRSQAELWIRENPNAWNALVSSALHEVRAERKFGMRQLIEQVRRKDYVAVDGTNSVIDNSLSPALARLLVEQHSEVRPYIELRRSACSAAFEAIHA